MKSTASTFSSDTATNAAHMAPLDLASDPAELTSALVDIYSVSDHEGPLADAVESALRALDHLTVYRDGDSIVARTQLGREQRVILAGHLDTVPLPTMEAALGTVPSVRRREGERDLIYGRGTTDMKGGVAVQLALAHHLTQPVRDVTYVFYDHEEVGSEVSGLGRFMRNSPELFEADFAVLLEPTDGTVEGGCNGTLRLRVSTTGKSAHSGRAWMGDNAIHKQAEVLARLSIYQPQSITVEGLEYREGLNAIKMGGGVAGNVIPDHAWVDVNYRFAPDKTVAQAQEHVRKVFQGFELEFQDLSPAARPGLDRPAAAEFVAAVGQEPKPKYGWTDVARFSQAGVPAVNFGPGDALLAHTDNEHVDAQAVRECYRVLEQWLS